MARMPCIVIHCKDIDMNAELPGAITAFFEASNGAADEAWDHCFEEQAVVRDESRTHQGREAIRAWLQEAQRKYAFRAEPLSVEAQDSGLKVRAAVSGSFPGSPIQLDYFFVLHNGRIASLEIQ